MKRRFASLVATAAGALALVPAANAATLPTLNVSLAGTKSVNVSGSTVSGAVSVTATHAGKGQGFFGLIRLNPGVTLQQAYSAVQSHHGDLNALTPYGGLLVSAAAPGTVETVLTPGSYVALNLSGNGQPGLAPFTVTQAASPAALPAAKATEASIEFGFRGPSVLHAGTIVRAENDGYLVHMIDLIGVKNRATGNRVIALLKAGKDHQAQRLASHNFASLLGPASPGAMQQQVLNAAPGYYVEACFMDTQDGREHIQLGMERLVRIVR
jgi:hypothetical protein